MENSEIVAILREDKTLFDFVFAFYKSNYKEFFKILVNITEKYFMKDKFLTI